MMTTDDDPDVPIDLTDARGRLERRHGPAPRRRWVEAKRDAPASGHRPGPGHDGGVTMTTDDTFTPGERGLVTGYQWATVFNGPGPYPPAWRLVIERADGPEDIPDDLRALVLWSARLGAIDPD